MKEPLQNILVGPLKGAVMEDKTKRSLIQELGSQYVSKKTGNDSRYIERTGSLTGKDPSLEDLDRESRIEVPIDKDIYRRISHNEWRAYMIRNTKVHPNDTLVFRELDGLTQTGQFLVRTVEYVVKGEGLKDGYVVAGWKMI